MSSNTERSATRDENWRALSKQAHASFAEIKQRASEIKPSPDEIEEMKRWIELIEKRDSE